MAKYWVLWYTTYDVWLVRWFTLYDNMLFYLGNSVFEPLENFCSYAMWQIYFSNHLWLFSCHRSWIHCYRIQTDSLNELLLRKPRWVFSIRVFSSRNTFIIVSINLSTMDVRLIGHSYLLVVRLPYFVWE